MRVHTVKIVPVVKNVDPLANWLSMSLYECACRRATPTSTTPRTIRSGARSPRTIRSRWPC
eukprot:9516571-Lingulodinium_polyedra.AAC.1